MLVSVQPLLRAASLLSVATLLQGCGLIVPRHAVANWEAQESYLVTYSYTLPQSSNIWLNSCDDPDIPVSLRCNGHGRCVEWFEAYSPVMDSNSSLASLNFCECDEAWADPECTTQRKSQVTAFLLSMFFGMFGADQFYLGFMLSGCLKLCSAGGLGIWWLYDIVRIGSTGVHTKQHFRLATDVHHWAFVLAVICYMGIIGLIVSLWSINHHQLKKARELMLLRSDELQSMQQEALPQMEGMQQPLGHFADMGQGPGVGSTFHGYGSTMGGYGAMTARRV